VFLAAAGVPVTPGSQQFDSGSGSFATPAYNTLIVEIWGAGGGSCSWNLTGPAKSAGTNGGASSVSTLSLSAGGGVGSDMASASSRQRRRRGGTASGGDTNTTGQAGSAGQGQNTSAASSWFGGKGGDSPNGGTGGAQTVDTNTTATGVAGNIGNAPGGGASGGAQLSSGTKCGTGGGGAARIAANLYVRRNRRRASVRRLLAYAVGVGGVRGVVTQSGFFLNGNSGAAGRVRFTWS